MAAAGCHVDVELAAGDVVAQRVVDQVGHEPLEEAGVAEDGRGGDRGADGQPAVSGVWLAGAQGVAGDVSEVEGLSAVEAALAAGQGQQRLDQLFLMFALCRARIRARV